MQAIVSRSWAIAMLASALVVGIHTATARCQPKVPATIEFNRDVRPILSNTCFACHGPDEGRREAEQRFDTEEGLLALRETGAIVPGDADKSDMLARIASDDPDLRMPPPDHPRQLTDRDAAVLRRWIEQGAKWQPHWAFIAPQRPELPAGDAVGNLANPVDKFIAARLQQVDVSPAPPAERATLLRRLSLDLIGLPPTPEELDQFLKDTSPAAYEKEVDRLLDSPHYGERMALYWLDLVRYADSVGYHKDSHQDVWLYRDYVISAFNNNKPYDRFTVEQLAGDLLEGSTFEQYEWKIASGFNRLNQTTSEGGAQAKEYLAKYAADRVRNTSAIFLGVTMGCAECHDHKYDPISARDFYSFAAFFADLQEAGVGVPKGTPMPSLEEIAAGQRMEVELESLQAQLQSSQENTDNKMRAEIQANIKSLEGQLAAAANAKQQKWSPTLVTVSGKPRTMRLLRRGNWLDDSGPVVEPATPTRIAAGDKPDVPATRVDLANWIVDRDNPLTARVFVNRLWRLLLGEGICRTVDDVGAQGEWPSHPELLDWLAVEFIDSGWDVKRMVKLIVMSEAYQRSSVPTAELLEKDPENHLFARQNRFRLPAELVRDNALAISGLLSPKMYGRSVKPYQPANYWYRMYHQGNYVQDHGEDLYRRGVYTYWRRSFWNPSLALFDAPSREECVARRPRSNTPQQALALLNDPTYVEAARVLAQRMIQDGGADADSRLRWAYRRALCREPLAWESEALTAHYNDQLQRFTDDEDAARKLASSGEFPSPKDIPAAEFAAWTSVARVILNLHETITRE